MICASMVNKDWDTRYDGRCYFFPERDCPGWEKDTVCFRIGEYIPKDEDKK